MRRRRCSRRDPTNAVPDRRSGSYPAFPRTQPRFFAGHRRRREQSWQDPFERGARLSLPNRRDVVYANTGQFVQRGHGGFREQTGGRGHREGGGSGKKRRAGRRGGGGAPGKQAGGGGGGGGGRRSSPPA